jgi:autophagy-related protein 9
VWNFLEKMTEHYESVQTEDEESGGDSDTEHEILFSSVPESGRNTLPHFNPSSKTSEVTDLDLFFSNLYQYHQQKGYYPMVIGKLASLFRTFFMVAFSTFFIAYLKWETMALCANQTLCELELDTPVDEFSSYIRPLALPPFPALVVTIFVLVFALYWLFDLLNFVFRQYWWISYCNHVYEYELQIPEHELRVMSWDQVILKYQAAHESGRYQVERRNEPSTEHEIAMRIMRKDNYFVYLVDQGMFRFHVCACCCCDARKWRTIQYNRDGTRKRKQRSRSGSSSDASPKCSWAGLVSCLSSCGAAFTWTAHLSPFLEHSLRWLITDELIQHKNQFRLNRQEFSNSASRFRRRSRCLALVVFLGMPFVLLFQVVYFFLRYAQEFSNSSTKGGGSGGNSGTATKFTPYWTWMFREYNELPHVFERRINLSTKPAKEYLSQFHNPLTTVLARSLYFVTGSFIALLLVMSLLGDNVMLYIKFQDRNLLWYLSFFGAIAAVCRSFIPAQSAAGPAASGAGKYVGNFQAATSGLLRQMITYTHYRPQEWSRKEHTLETRDDVARQMKSQLVCTLLELRSTLYLPWLLAFHLPAKSEELITMIEEGTAAAPRFSSNLRDSSIGDVCRPALFLFADRQSGEDLSRSTGGVSRSVSRSTTSGGGGGGKGEGETKQSNIGGGSSRAFRYHSSNKKIEKSLLSFRSQHPRWAAVLPAHNNQTGGLNLSESHTGNDLIAKLVEFQHEQVGGLQSTGNSGNGGLASSARQSTTGGHGILEQVQQDLTASQVLSSSGTVGAIRNANDSTAVTAALQSASARLGGSNFFTTNHMIDLPLDHPMTGGLYPSAEPQFFWLDKFYEAQRNQ